MRGVCKMKRISDNVGLRHARRGGAAVEYVIVAVLIAAACLIAVVVLGRGIVRNTDIMNKAATGRGNRAGEAAEVYRQDAAEDVKEAEKFPGEFSDAGKSVP